MFDAMLYHAFKSAASTLALLALVLTGSAQSFLIEAVDFPDVPACSNTTVHAIRITNQFGELAEDLTVTLTFPDGMVLENVVSGPVFVSAQSGNQVTLTGPVFLVDGADLEFSYTVSVSCEEALPASTLVEASCQLTTDLASQGTQTLGFNYLAPSVLIMNVDNASVEALPGESYTRPLTLRNAGNYPVEEVRVSFDFANDFVAVTAASAGTLQDGYIQLTAADFPGGALDPEEDFILTLTEEVVNCQAEPILYEAQWFCGTDLCQTSTGTADTNPPPGEPNVVLLPTSAADPLGCEIPGQTSFLLQNASTELYPGAAAAHDVRLSFGFTWPDNGNINTSKYAGEYFVVTSVEVDGTTYPLAAPIIDPDISNTNAIYQVTLDELPAASSVPVVVNWYYRHPHIGDPDCGDMDEVTFHGKLNGQANFTNTCGEAKPRVFAEGNGSYFQYRLVDQAIVAPTDVLEGDTFTFGILEDFRIEGALCANPVYRLALEVPAGFIPQPGTAYATYLGGSLPATFTEPTPGMVMIEVDLGGPSSAPIYDALEVGVDFALDCSGDSSGGIDYAAYLACGDCDSDAYTAKLDCGTALKPVADCGDCSGIQLQGFPELHRLSLGYTDASMTTPITLADAEANGTAHRAYVHDLVEMTVPATVNDMAGITSPELVLTHPAMATGNLLEPQAGFEVTFTPAFGAPVTEGLSAPIITDVGGLFEYRFDLSDALETAFGPGATLSSGDAVEVHGTFRITDQFEFEDKTAFVEVPELRVRFEADGALCNSRGFALEVAHPNYVWLVDNSLEQLAGCANFEVGFNFRNRNLNNVPHFPGEFRPTFLANTFTLYVPNGWSIAPGSERLEYLPQDACDLASLQEMPLGTADAEIPDATGRTLVWNNDGSWPVKDDGCVYYGTHYRFVVRLVPECDAELGDQIYMPATLDVTTFAYAEEAFQETSVETYGTFRPSDYWVDTDFGLTTVLGTSQNGSSQAEWIVRLVNQTGAHEVQNIWMAFPALADVELELTEVLDLQSGAVLELFSNDSTSWVFADTIPAGGFLDYRVRANILGCNDHTFQVFAGKDCGELGAEFSPDVDPCDPQDITLGYVQQPTGLQVNFSAPSAASSLCGVEYFEIELNNALPGFARNLRLTAVLPENVTWMQDSSLFQFPGPPELTDNPGPAVWGSLPLPTLQGDSLVWMLEDLLPDSLSGLGLPGAEFTEANAAYFVVGVRPECGFLQGDELRFFIDYESACGQPQETIASGVQAVYIDGINETLQTQFSLESEPLSICSDTTLVTLRIDILAEDLLEETTVQQSFALLHPAGFEVLENTFVNLYNADFLDTYDLDVQSVDPETFTAAFPLPSGMVSGDSLAFSFLVDRSALTEGSYDLVLEGESEINAFCDGNLCFIKRRLGVASTLFEEVPCIGNQPPVAVNDTILMSPGGITDLITGTNDYDPEDAMDLLYWEMITPPGHGDASLIDWGLLAFVADIGYTGQDSLQYVIRDELGATDTAWVFIQMYNPEVSCNQLFVNTSESATIENCEGVYTYCLPMLYDALVDYNLYVDGAVPDSIAECNTLSFTAYGFEDAEFLTCLPEGQFPMDIESWEIEGQTYGPVTVNSMPDLAQWMNVLDPCGFWSVDADGRLRGGMVVLDYGPLVLTSPCTGATESFAWNVYSVPQNPAVLLTPGCHEIVLESLELWECRDTIEVCVDCLGIVNTPPYTVEEGLPVDTFYTVTYQDMMIDFCFEFEDDENHVVGITEVEETIPETTVFYFPGDSCICYLPPPGYLGMDTVYTNYCDVGDPVLCNEAVLIVEVLPLDELNNTPPYTVDNLGIPEDTLWVTVPPNLTTDYCLNFVDDEGHNVTVTDWVDFATDGSTTDFPLLDGCMQYTPAPGFVGSDIILVNYCDDGDPSLCNFTWLVLEIDPLVDPNDPPDVLDDDGLPTDTLYYTIYQNQPLQDCLEVSDDPDQTVTLGGIVVPGSGTVWFDGTDTCLDYLPPLDYIGTDVVTLTVCDDAVNAACTQVTLVIEVLPFDCPEFSVFDGDTLNPVVPGCVGNYNYVFPFFLTEIDLDQVTVNGEPTEVVVTETVEMLQYNVANLLEVMCADAAAFPVELNGLSIDGSQYSGGVAQNWAELLAVLNATDPFLTWSAVQDGVFQLPLNPAHDYGTMQLFAACSTLPQFVQPDTLDVPFVGRLELQPDSCYEIGIVVRDTGCPYTLTVCPQCASNTPPYTVDQDGSLDLDFELSTNVGESVDFCFDLADAEGDEVVVTGVEVSAASAFVLWEEGATCLMYTPDANDPETVVFTIDYCDNGDPVLCNASTLTVTVGNNDPDNNPPVALDDLATAEAGTQIEVDILANDSDPDGDPLTVTVQQCGQGFGAWLNGVLYYQAPLDYCGPDSVCYTICDPGGLCDWAVVYVQVTATDSDMDGLPDFQEGTGDPDDDGLPNWLDADSDNDGLSDGAEASMGNPDWDPCADPPVDSDGDGDADFEDTDSDNDGLLDDFEGTGDCDGDGTPDYLDPDSCDPDVEPEPEVWAIPQGFSPNDDGVGDLWIIDHIEQLGEVRVQVFNRWGHEVYASNDYQNDWDGHMDLYGARRPDPLPSGTYYYVLEATALDAPVQGWVYLTR